MTVLTAPTAEAIAIDAQSFKAQALDFTATLNRITPTVAGVWELGDTKKEVPDENDTIFVPHKNPGPESVIEADDRIPVAPEHFAPGGKYRAILKLFIQYENLPETAFAHGTGWLIRPDLMVTAGHNVYSYSKTKGKIPGRARQIKAYAGYNGAASVSSPSVEFHTAKRVVTTSHWLDNKNFKARDFALVQFDKPFTDVTPFQYIETAPEGDLVLGVVGYPADLYDEKTGEKGGRMHELFEHTKYDITEDADKMLKHYIDAEGGNSGGPILRGSDLVAVATHVYGGSYNTASLLGRYGNPIQDYIGALEVPLANAGQINMVPVGEEHISQANAATGPQVKEITKLGDNVLAPMTNSNGTASGTSTNGIARDTDSSKTEFWIFERIEEIFNMTKNLASTVGPVIAGPIGAVILPTIIEGIKRAQPGDFNQFDVNAALRRALLANSTLLGAEQRAENGKLEGFLDTIRDVLKTIPFQGTVYPKPEGILDVVGSPVIRLPFKEMMDAIGVTTYAADQLVNDVAAEITRGLLLRAKIAGFALQMAKPEAAIEVDAPACSNNEKDFAKQLAEATSSKPESVFDDVGKFFQDVSSEVNNIASDSARLVSKYVVEHALNVKNKLNDVGNNIAETARDASNTLDDAARRTVQEFVLYGTVIPRSGLIPQNMAILLSNAMGVKKPEGAFDESKPENFLDDLLDLGRGIAGTVMKDALLPILGLDLVAGNLRPENAFDELKPEAIFDLIAAGVRKISQALILQFVIADQFLTTQMARPTVELKAEGFFDDLSDFFSDKGNIQTIIDFHPLGPVLGPLLGSKLLGLL
ncbi:hypothetical protein MMC32_000991 [Xylographa parallela]|nr:hypothetical protein [Xylographa parallela]